jgi:hypothetical protein
MPTVIRYCRGCNEQFTATEDDPRCPVCRQAMTVWDVSPTMDLGQTEVCDRPSSPAKRRAAPLELIDQAFAGYTIEGFLGQGGMAWVFRARHQALQRPCAIKILRTDLRSRDQDFLQLFIAEARAAASVVHPHIVTVHNIGEARDYHFIELEYVPGPSLQHLVQTEQRLAPVRATHLLTQACGALAAAHRQGLVHRDFKPANVLVAEHDFAKLADFGLAKRIAAGHASDAPGALVGTPYFMAPELFQGRAATPQSDVYAVGVSYFHLLTGRHPFVDRDLASLIEQHTASAVPALGELVPDLAPEIADLVQRCLAKAPQDRPRDGDELHHQLQQILLRLRDLKSLVAEAGCTCGWQQQDDDRRIALTVALPGGRRQRVFIEERCDGPGAEPIIRLYSVCGPADERCYRGALELNARIAHGSLALESIDGVPHFVMVNCYPRCTCDAAEIRRSVQEMSLWADTIEQALLEGDQH